MKPTQIQVLREKIEAIVQEKLESGDGYLTYGIGASEDKKGGYCLLALVTGDICFYSSKAGKIFGLNWSEVDQIEQGFENWGYDSTPLYQLGAYLREKYV